MHAVTVTCGFEAAHRLPQLPGKCQSLHGHSWRAAVTVSAAGLAAGGVLLEFGEWKTALRGWIDEHLDHGSILGTADPLVPVLKAHGCKVHEMPGWPTVELVAAMIGGVARSLIGGQTRAPGAVVKGVRIRETAVNEASWVP